jgi:hypothetical protein
METKTNPMSNLTILTVVENDKGLLDLMLRSVAKFTQPQPNIIICDQGNNGNLIEKYKYYPYITIVQNTPTLSGGSNRHGQGLDKIFGMVKTNKAAIVESDCIVTKQNWDIIPHPKRAIAAHKGVHKGLELYHVCFLVFYTSDLQGIDFRPGNKRNRYNRSYGIHEDVGWQIGTKLDKKEIKLMEFVDCKSGKGKVFDSRFQSDEFWVDGCIISAHYGRGSNIGGKAIRKGFKHPSEQLKEWREVADSFLK